MYYPDDSIYRSDFKRDLEELHKQNRQSAEDAEKYGKQAITQAKVLTQREKALFEEQNRLQKLLDKLKLNPTNNPVEISNIKAKIEHIGYAKALADKATTRFVTGWGESPRVRRKTSSKFRSFLIRHLIKQCKMQGI